MHKSLSGSLWRATFPVFGKLLLRVRNLGQREWIGHLSLLSVLKFLPMEHPDNLLLDRNLLFFFV